MVKKLILISFLVFITSCSAIGRGVLIDSLLKNAVKGLQKEEKEEKNKNSHPNSKVKEKVNNDHEENEDDDDEEFD
ncbi:hypothetical protein [Borreliella turdi]|uniref:hypothetical protein n=1 Tax=Borreliella turdi TaxID=57863 RepID=UPI001247B377|nr:hypothetical protein [Borreliella turdi]